MINNLLLSLRQNVVINIFIFSLWTVYYYTRIVCERTEKVRELHCKNFRLLHDLSREEMKHHKKLFTSPDDFYLKQLDYLNVYKQMFGKFSTITKIWVDLDKLQKRFEKTITEIHNERIKSINNRE